MGVASNVGSVGFANRVSVLTETNMETPLLPETKADKEALCIPQSSDMQFPRHCVEEGVLRHVDGTKR